MKKRRRDLLNLDRLGRTYGVRPSAILGIEDEWAAYQFDLAAMALGNRVEKAIIDKEDVSALLGEKAGKVDKKRFASLKGQARKIKIPDSGIW